MKFLASLAVVAALSACGPPHRDSRGGPYQGLPRQLGEAQLILDTSTGCVFRPGAVSNTDFENGRPPKCMDTREIFAASGFKIIERSPDQKPTKIIYYDAKGNRISNSAQVTATANSAGNQ